ncbi:hypothetical protein AYL99_05304 [Fonsecaea erecta]|uniref:Nephrocystin 3-like N-terminal domain-containing protein n=1 Tax=Fonsecaea erecta TaxID=1367422 RepID=A0A178ZKW2_9EURO|nr:hypothetical protein AYL99_05304 [Fonsecaea erecta]OAP60302.1 hypothetical protein AYL99_05304 [Fonsecaea erecta]
MSAGHGLNMLHAPDSTEAIVDIIAVHGLGPQASSWLLSVSRDLPEARLFAYGYDFELQGIGLVEEQGIHLLEALSQTRSADNTSDRPLVFIAHSLGGLIVKQALICSQARVDSTSWPASNLTRLIKGIVFVGTPHCVNDRTDRAIWKFLQLCASGANLATVEKRLHDILPPLQSISTKFKDYLNTAPNQIKLVSFFEEPDTLGFADNSPSLSDTKMTHVVLKEDAVLEGFDCVPIRGDHTSIWKSLSSNSVNYRRILAALKVLTIPFSRHGSKLPENHDADAGALFQLEDGRQRIASPADGTLSWLGKNSVFERWAQNDDTGFLWIRGKAGSGKSTLMKYMLDRGNYPVAAKTPVLTLSYFFDPFKGRTKLSASDFYRALLYQLWEQARHLPCEHDILASTELHFTSQLRGNRANEPSLLAEQLNLLLFDISENHPVYIFIDALDECAKNEVVSILEFLRQALGRAPTRHLRICVSSRNTLSCSTEDASVFVDQENKEDIVSFTETQIQIRAAKYGDSLLHLKDEVLNIILEKADGMFLWVSLAIHIIYNETRNSADILRVLRSLPTDLNSVYRRILENIQEEKPQVQLQISRTLSWVLFASRPLSVQELAAALSPVYRERSEIHQIHHLEEHVSFDSIPNFTSVLTERTWGLVKTVYSKYDHISECWSKTDHTTVHLLHSSVKDFLSTSQFLMMHSSQKSAANAAAVQNLQFARLCLNYCAKSVEAFEQPHADGQDLNAVFPLLGYSSTFWLKHLQIANGAGISEEVWADIFPLPSEKLLHSWSRALVLVGKDARLYQSSSILHVAAYYNLSRLVRMWARNMEKELKTRRSADKIQDLTGEASPRIDLFKEPSNLNQLLNQTDTEGRTALSLASETGGLEVCKLLVDYGADLHIVDRKYGYSPLMWAVAAGNMPTMSLLLNSGADVNDLRSGISPLCLAATAGNVAVVRLLLDHGAMMDSEGPTSDRPPTSSGFQDKVYVHSELPIHGRMMSVAGYLNLGPLHYAILGSNLSTIGLLLMKGAEAAFGYADALSRYRFLWLNRIILSMRQDPKMVDCTILQQCHGSNGRGSNSTRRNGSNSTRGSHTDSPMKRKLVSDGSQDHADGHDDNDSDDDDDAGRPPPNKRPNLSFRDDIPTNKKPPLTYACPYFKYAPNRYGCQKACSAHGWRDVSRLKQHLHEKHYIHLCDRCGERFEGNEQRQEHRRAQEACPSVPTEQRQRDFADGFDDDQKKKLHDKTMKKNQANNNEKTYWEEVYKTCFPDAIGRQIPSPYFEEAADARYNMFLMDTLRRSPSARSLIEGYFDSEVAARFLNDLTDFITEIHTQFQTAGGSGTQFQQGMFPAITQNAPRPAPMTHQQPDPRQASIRPHSTPSGNPVEADFRDDSAFYSQDQEFYSMPQDPEMQQDAQMSLLSPIEETILPQSTFPAQPPWSSYSGQSPPWLFEYPNTNPNRYPYCVISRGNNEGRAHNPSLNDYQFHQTYDNMRR